MTPSTIRTFRRRPLHPPLTHTALGAVVIAAVLDVVSMIDGGTHPWSRELFRAGTFDLMVGVSVMALAALTGLADRARHTTPGSRPRRMAARHGLTMALLVVVSVIDVSLRRGHYTSATSTPVVVLLVGLLALAIAVIGGDLGGQLVYTGGVGVRPAATGTLRNIDARPGSDVLEAPAGRSGS